MHIVYVIQHKKTFEVYVGQTDNLTRRLEQHNSGSNCSTHRRNADGQWVLIYAEAYRNKTYATERETKLKQRGSAKHWLKKRLNRSFLEP